MVDARDVRTDMAARLRREGVRAWADHRRGVVKVWVSQTEFAWLARLYRVVKLERKED